MVQMTKQFSISYPFEAIDVMIFCTLWWLQQYRTYQQPQVASIYYMRPYEISVPSI